MDLSKIDFTKLNEDADAYQTRRLVDEIHVVAMSGAVVASRTAERGWAIDGRRHAECLVTLADYCLKVDAFIVTETARIEAEEEKVNWVAVPWMDVEWLDGLGATVKLVTDDGDMIDSVDASEHCNYRADRRTFPAGYDPTMPRWVGVDCYNAKRLNAIGSDVRVQTLRHGEWSPLRRDSQTFSFHRYDVDAHTLPPGVPLHEEPKPEDSTDQYHASKLSEPKPEPRPCTKEFALAHPEESEARRDFSANAGIKQWGTWGPIGMFSFEAVMSRYEFRTTAKEEPQGTEHRHEIVSDYCRITTTELHYISSDITGLSFRVETRVDDKQAREIERLYIDGAIVRITVTE